MSKNRVIYISDRAREIMRARGITEDCARAFTIGAEDRDLGAPRLRSRLTIADLEALEQRDRASAVTDPEGLYSSNPPSGLADANARYSRLLARTNRRNRDFWGGSDAA
jgi:hypothetical protein